MKTFPDVSLPINQLCWLYSLYSETFKLGKRQCHNNLSSWHSTLVRIDFIAIFHLVRDIRLIMLTRAVILISLHIITFSSFKEWWNCNQCGKPQQLLLVYNLSWGSLNLFTFLYYHNKGMRLTFHEFCLIVRLSPYWYVIIFNIETYNHVLDSLLLIPYMTLPLISRKLVRESPLGLRSNTVSESLL